MAQKHCRKFQPAEYGTRTLQTDNGQTDDGCVTAPMDRERLTARRRVQLLLLAFLLSQLTSQNANLSSQLTRQEHVSFCTSHALLHCIARTTYVDAVYCYRPSSVVCRLVGLSVTLVSPAKTAEAIGMPFGLRTLVGPWNHVLDCGPDRP